jgi:CheY-like chemotaxis protein
MATAYGRQEVMRRADEVGLDGFLIKPVNPSVMLNTIMEVFGKEVERSLQIRTEKARGPSTLGKIKGARILLVEDNEINQQVAHEILSGAGFEVTLAINGQEAVNAVQQNPYDAVLMDIQMPVMDGYAATRKIREWERDAQSAKLKTAESAEVSTSKLPPSASNIPIIAMTAHAMMGDREKSMAAGMNDHVAKPIDPDDLFTVLEKWIPPKTDQPGRVPTDTENVGDTPVVRSDQTSSRPGIHIENDELPLSLPGFDLEAGLKRLQGNRKLYRKLLLHFGTDYKKASANIHKALIANDIKQVHSLVHNIKGLAGNLSAIDLQEAAANMDSSVKKVLSGGQQMPGDLDPVFAEMKTALEQALASCQSLQRSDDEKSGIDNDGSLASIPPDLASRIAGQLQTAADMGDVNSLKSTAEQLKSESESYTPFSDKIIKLAENFDFESILKLVEELNSRNQD